MTKFFQNLLQNFKDGWLYFLAALFFAAGIAFVAIHLLPIAPLYDNSMTAAFTSAMGVAYAFTSTVAIITAYKKAANGRPYGYNIAVYFASTIVAAPPATWLVRTFIERPEGINFQTDLLIMWIVISTLALLVHTKKPFKKI